MILEKFMIGAGILLVHFLNRSPILDLSDKLPFGFQPDLMFIFVIFFALRQGGLTGLWVGFLSGILIDVDLGEMDGADGKKFFKMGLHSLSYSLIGYLTGKIGRRIYNENFATISITLLVLTLIMRGMVYFLFTFFFHPNDNYSFLGTAVYNAIISPVFFSVLSWVYRLESTEVDDG